MTGRILCKHLVSVPLRLFRGAVQYLSPYLGVFGQVVLVCVLGFVVGGLRLYAGFFRHYVVRRGSYLPTIGVFVAL